MVERILGNGCKITFIDHDYIVGDLVSYCNRPAIVTLIDGTLADVLLLDSYTVSTTGVNELHYLGPGREYLRKAHEMGKLYMLIERLEALRKEQEHGQQ